MDKLDTRVSVDCAPKKTNGKLKQKQQQAERRKSNSQVSFRIAMNMGGC